MMRQATPKMVDLDTLTIGECARRLRSHQLTAEELTESCLQRIDRSDPDLNAFILVMAETARQAAREADRELRAGHDRGMLHGVPISIKDLLHVAATPTTAGSRVREGHVAPHDCPVVAALRKAGAVLIGKTNLHEFAFGTTNEESAFGPSRNPHDRSRSPGGSSGGSAVSVAAGMALATIGTDTGGSIRIPAAACGIVGLKPRLGEVSTEGVVPLSARLDHVGPLARSVTDAWLVYRVLVGDPRSVAPSPRPVSSLHLAVPRGYLFELLDDEVRARFEEAIDRIRAAGARVDDVHIRHARLTPAIYLHIVLADAAAYHAYTLERMPERYTPSVRTRLELGRYVLGEDYVLALQGREVLRREVDTALASHDAMVLPTLPIPAPPLGAATIPLGGAMEPVRSLMLRLTQLFNLTGHPVVALPTGRTAAGLPCSMQLVGRDTESLLSAALACEARIAAC
jgi:aspartyl-tRNA(Asn)/glutamyl-tRNA(Gln) amidotransferase subunit A